MRISKEERLGKQELRLLEYLENNKSINPIMSWQALGIYRLSDVVFKLRNRGYDIETKRKTVINKWQEKTSFAEYKLERAS
jgi:hypothetical protein